MKQRYSFTKYEEATMAKALGSNVSISTKHAIEICNFLKKKKVSYAKRLLEEVKEFKTAVPMKRYTNGAGHKKGKIAAGQYPIKASTVILKLLESAETNAQQKGLNTADLKIIHMCAHKAARPMRMGRQRSRQTKRSHVEIIIQEVREQAEVGEAKVVGVKPKVEEKVAEAKPEVKKEQPKLEAKKSEVKEEKNVEAKPKVEEKKPEIKEKVVEKKEAPKETKKVVEKK